MSSSSAPRPERRRARLRLSAWNLLLLVPMLMLITPWFNRDQPRLIGLPFFYWYQFAFVPIGVACVAIVYVMTRKASGRGDSARRRSVEDQPEETNR